MSLFLISVMSHAEDLLFKFVEHSHLTRYIGEGIWTGRGTVDGDFAFQSAVADCEWQLAVSVQAQFKLHAPQWPQVAHGRLSPERIAWETQILERSQIESRSVPPELMATDFAPMRYSQGGEIYYPQLKEVWVLTDYNLYHHYPMQGPSVVEPGERGEHDRMQEALMRMYRESYDDQTLKMVTENEKTLPRHRKKIIIVRQPYTVATFITAYVPDIQADYIATMALFDASNDPWGPRLDEGPEGFLSPVERILKKEGRGKNVLDVFDQIRTLSPYLPIFELQNYILKCGGLIAQYLCAMQMHGWLVHQYLRHYPNGHMIIHTMKESTTKVAEERFGVSRAAKDFIVPVLRDDGSGEQAISGEHVFIVPIEKVVHGLRAWQERAHSKLVRVLPGFKELAARYRKSYDQELARLTEIYAP